MASWTLCAVAVSAVILFYLLAWWWWGKDPKPGTIVTRYEPPRGISPALMRYIWKERFDERVLWSAFLSLVSRGLVVLDRRDDATYIRPVWPPQRRPELPRDEFFVYDELTTARCRKGIRWSLVDERMAHIALGLANRLRITQQGRWFLDHRNVVIAGSALSAVALLLAANLYSMDRVLALLVPSVLMAVGGFYGYFLVQRIWELVRVAREHPGLPIFSRALLLILLGIPSAAAVGMGCSILYIVFGPALLFVAAGLVFTNLLFLDLMKAPIAEGRKLLDEIEGFRNFLTAVERLPMDLPNLPKSKVGLYERYLPYALALEVEQQWCDQTSAFASSDHEMAELGQGVCVYHIGMWDGRVVEITYNPKYQ